MCLLGVLFLLACGGDSGGAASAGSSGGDRDAASPSDAHDAASGGQDARVAEPDAGRAPDAARPLPDAAPADGGAPDADAASESDAATDLETIDELITRCPSAGVIAAIDADFELVWEADVTAGTLVCRADEGSADLTKAQERVYQGLIAARALEFDEPLPWTELPLYDWLAQSIDGIIFRDDIANSFCCTAGPSGTGTYLNLIVAENWTALYTDLWSNEYGIGLVGFIDLVVHEARHANGPSHTCPDNASDRTATELGAWGTVYQFHRWLAFHSDPCFLRPTLPANAMYPQQVFDADAYLIASRDYADDLAMLRFCETPPEIADPPEPVTACADP